MSDLEHDDTRIGDTLASGDAEHVTPALERATELGRYVILDRLGAGGMGVVYVAFDPELDRKVAIKVHHAELGGDGAGVRLQSEAQALAKLAHPNVVGIYDVGTIGDDVWIAMEFVEGETFGKWRERVRPSWAEVLAAIEAVGLGLAAAHAQGLVHRDVKPDNIMVGSDGRVRVMDFGLARPVPIPETTDVAEPGDDDAAPRPRSEALRERLTQHGAIVGTPAYMAPEQVRAKQTDARTDQFALCVVAWEALYGERPFKGATLAELAARILDGDLPAVPRANASPRWIHPVLARGLAREARDRYESVDALLADLRRRQRRARLRRVLAGVGAVSVAVTAAAGFRWAEHRSALAECETESRALEAVWSEQTQQDVRSALVGVDELRGADTFARVEPQINAWSRRWAEARVEACVNVVEGHWAQETGMQGRDCLDEQRLAFEALVERLEQPDERTLEAAVPGASRLAGPERCTDERALARRPMLPNDEAVVLRVRELRGKLIHARSLRDAGQFTQALDATRSVLADARELGWQPLVAAGLSLSGELEGELGDYPAAETALSDAYFLALASEATDVAVASGTRLVYLVGNSLSRHDDASIWARHVEELLRRVDGDALSRATLLNNVGTVRYSAGDFDGAEMAHRDALDLRRGALGEEHLDVAVSHGNHAAALMEQGQLEQARAEFERALLVKESVVGKTHPSYASTLDGYARVLQEEGDLEDAAKLYERVLAIQQVARGRESKAVADVLRRLANVRRSQGLSAEAERLHVEALEIYRTVIGPDSANVAAQLLNLSNVYTDTARTIEAKDALERALAIQERTLPSGHIELLSTRLSLATVALGEGELRSAGRMFESLAGESFASNDTPPAFKAVVLVNYALLKQKQGTPAEARVLALAALLLDASLFGSEHPNAVYPLRLLADLEADAGNLEDSEGLERWALRIREQSFGPDHPRVAASLAGISAVLNLRGSNSEAEATAERAVRILRSAGADAVTLADALFELGKARAALGHDREAVVRPLEEAVEIYGEAGDAVRKERVERWLTDNASNYPPDTLR